MQKKKQFGRIAKTDNVIEIVKTSDLEIQFQNCITTLDKYISLQR